MRRRAFIKTAGSTGIALSLAGCSSIVGSSSENENEIVGGTAAGFPPFVLKEDGELTGYDIEVLEAAVQESEYELANWETFDFQSLIPALQDGKIDVLAGAMTITDERDERIDFTDPYYSVNQAILVQEGGDFAPSSLSDLSGHSIGAQQGSTGEKIIQEDLIDPGELDESNYRGYGTYVLSVEDLSNGNVDAIAVDAPVAKTFASNRSVQVAFTVDTGEEYGYGVQDGADDLRSGINSGLQTIRDSGEYEEIRNNWFGSNE